ncbi:MAG TPA: adenylate kinase [Ktedonobacteraceae bacterium]
MHIILIGAQGSGKGTQAEMLAHALGVPHVASGDLFRKEIEEQSETGRQASEYINRGRLVPDDLTVGMILNRLKQPDCTPGVLMDGFPRTLAQAEALDRSLREVGRQMDAVVYLNVPREELLRRLSGRSICKAHQHVYNMSSRPPKVAGVCDLDGSELYQRSDDVGEAVEHRLDIFFNETIRLLDYYGAQGKVVEVNGYQGIEEVQQALVDAIRRRIDAA